MTGENYSRAVRRTGEGTLVTVGALSIAAAFKADREKTQADLSHLDDRADLITVPGEGDLSTTVLIGNSASAALYAKEMGPHLSEFGDVRFVVYPQKKFSIESIQEKFLEATDLSKERKALVFVSMGELVGNHLVADKEVSDQVGDVDYVVVESGVTRIANLQPKPRALLTLGSHIPLSHLIAEAYRIVREKAVSSAKLWEHDPAVPAEIVREHMISSALTPLYKNVGEWQYMDDRQDLPPGATEHFYRNVLVRAYLSAYRDRTVKLKESHRDLQIESGCEWEWIKSKDRPRTSHAALPEFPNDLRTILRRRTIRQQIVELSEVVPIETAMESATESGSLKTPLVA